MKLYTKIAGTLALPLALAVAANSAQAYTVVDTSEHKLAVGGFIAAIASWSKTGSNKVERNDKFNSDMHAGTSRLNIAYTNKEIGTLFFYEQQFVSGTNADPANTNGLRHAYFKTEDGWIGGQTWSFGTNLVALAETIDTDGNSMVSYQVYGPRNLLLGKKFKLDDSMSFGVAIEGKNAGGGAKAQKSVAPAVSANFEGNFGGIKVFTAVTNYAVNKKQVESGYNPVTNTNDAPKKSGKDKRFTRFTVGTAIPMGDATLKLGVTHNAGITDKGKALADDRTVLALNSRTAKGTHASAALTYRINEKIRTNLAVEASRWDKKAFAKKYDTVTGDPKKNGSGHRVWLNAFYQADNGIEWGAELQLAKLKVDNDLTYVAGETHEGRLNDKGTAFRVQAKYAF